jgi:hypothetical protein
VPREHAEHVPHSGPRGSGVLVLLGGAAALIGSLLPWVRVSTDRTATTVAGISSWQGAIALICGALLIFLGIVFVRSTKPGRGRGVAAMVLGVVAAGVVVHVIGTQDAQIDEGIRRNLRAGGPVRKAEVRQAHASLLEGGLEVTLLPGLFLSLAGGLAGLTGGAVAVGRGSEQAPGYSDRP